MDTMIAIGFIALLLNLMTRYARQEYFEDDYEDAIIDVESRLEWAFTRRYYPFGMKAQLDVSKNHLQKAKNLWENNMWNQAYRKALESQEAMNRAQNLYSSALVTHYQSAPGKREGKPG